MLAKIKETLGLGRKLPLMPPPEPLETNMPQEPHRVSFSPEFINPQKQCPLFAVLPGEIRNQIFEYALEPYFDMSQEYDHETCYKRPDDFAPTRRDTALLRTCKLIYEEAWFRSWSVPDPIFYLAWPSRRPIGAAEEHTFQKLLDFTHSLGLPTKVKHVKVFAQTYQLVSGSQLQSILNMDHFHPEVITITVRHTDCAEWEIDDNLRMTSLWVGFCRFPASLKEIRFSIESLERKKDQVEELAQQAMDSWKFLRKDNVYMKATRKDITRWSGSSTWEGMRWIRDEARPNELDYYIATVSYTPSEELYIEASDREPAKEEVRDDDVAKIWIQHTSVPILTTKSRPRFAASYIRLPPKVFHEAGVTADDDLDSINLKLTALRVSNPEVWSQATSRSRQRVLRYGDRLN